MKLTNCYRYMAVLYTASCGAASPLYGPLETGLQESQLLNSLKTCKSLEGPETDAYLSRTGLNGAYKTKKPIGGLFFSLHFEYGKDGGLKAVSFYSTTKAGKEEYDTRLKSLYKRMLNGLTGLYGPPMNLPDWIEKESLPAERVLYMHMWRLQPGCFLMAGLANMGASGYIPVFRISPPSGMPPKSRKDRNKLKSEWAAIPEFYEFIKAERFLANAVFAMSHKKYPDALQLFQKAADLGSPNGYWGLAHLYRLGPDGVEKNMRLADEYTRKSALSGFARAAMKFGKRGTNSARARTSRKRKPGNGKTGIFAPPGPATPPSNTIWESSACTDSAWKKTWTPPGNGWKRQPPRTMHKPKRH